MKFLLVFSLTLVLAYSTNAGVVVGWFAGCTHDIPVCHQCDQVPYDDPACDLGGGRPGIVPDEDTKFSFDVAFVDDLLVSARWIFDSH